MHEPLFSWVTDFKRAVYVEVVGNRFGFKWITHAEYERKEQPPVDAKWSVSGILRAENVDAGRIKINPAYAVGFALMRRNYRQSATQRHCKTCHCE